MIKGYFPIALSFEMKVYSLFPSASLTIRDVNSTFALSDSYVILTSFFCFGPIVPMKKKREEFNENRYKNGFINDSN